MWFLLLGCLFLSNFAHAQPVDEGTITKEVAQINVEKINYPLVADTTEKKMTFCYIAQEKLRAEHNLMGEKFRNGEITEQEWKDYVNNVFDKKQSTISHDLQIQKRAMKVSTMFQVDLNALEKP